MEKKGKKEKMTFYLCGGPRSMTCHLLKKRDREDKGRFDGIPKKRSNI